VDKATTVEPELETAVHPVAVVAREAQVVQQQDQATQQELAAQLEMAYSTHSSYQEQVRST
jgi:hypothetical protein